VLVERGRRLLEVSEEGAGGPVAAKRRLPGQALVEHAAQRVDIDGRVGGFAFDLLGREVVGGAGEVGFLVGAAFLGAAGETEVGEVDVAVFGQEHVAGLDVAVDEPARVRRVQAGRDRSNDGDCALWAEWPFLVEQGGEVGALDVAHGDVEQPVGLAGVVYRDHVGVVE
jgi:hypothetical protein